MNRKKADLVRRKINDILELFEQELKDDLNVSVSLGTGSFNPSNLTIKVEVSDIGEDGKVKSREAEDFVRIASIFGLNPDDLGKKFVGNGVLYEIVGAKPRSTKFPILAKRRDGSVFKFRPSYVKELLSNYEKKQSEDLEMQDLAIRGGKQFGD